MCLFYELFLSIFGQKDKFAFQVQTLFLTIKEYLKKHSLFESVFWCNGSTAVKPPLDKFSILRFIDFWRLDQSILLVTSTSKHRLSCLLCKSNNWNLIWTKASWCFVGYCFCYFERCKLLRRRLNNYHMIIMLFWLISFVILSSFVSIFDWSFETASLQEVKNSIKVDLTFAIKCAKFMFSIQRFCYHFFFHF